MSIIVTRPNLKGTFIHAGTASCKVCGEHTSIEFLIPVNKDSLRYKDATGERLGQLLRAGKLVAIENPIWCKCTK